MCTSPLLRFGTFDKKEISLIKKAGYAYKNGGFIFSLSHKKVFCEKFNIPESSLDYCQCGQCYECRLRQAKEWGVKALLESLYYDKSCFITLTYEDNHLPYAGYINSDGEASSFICVPTLVKKDVQDFMKRLRKRLKAKPNQLRYICAGEYGEKNTRRPHYHILLFGEDFKTSRYPFLKDRRDLKSRKKFPLFESDILTEVWGKGYACFGDVTSNSCVYACGYTLKKLKGVARKEQNENCVRMLTEDTRIMLEEFCGAGMLNKNIRIVGPHIKNDKTEDFTFQDNFILHSNKPGIGRAYYEEHKDDIYNNDEIILPGNIKFKVVKPPRTFDRLFEVDNYETMERIKSLRKSLVTAQRNLEMKRTNMTEEEILSARAVSNAAKVKALRKRL